MDALVTQVGGLPYRPAGSRQTLRRSRNFDLHTHAFSLPPLSNIVKY